MYYHQSLHFIELNPCLYSLNSLQTCKRWNRLACNPSLWKAQCQALSTREGVGDLSRAVEIAFGHPLEEHKLDWKKTYRDLRSVMSRVKEMVLKAAKAESQNVSGLNTKINSATIRKMYSLQQMLQIRKSCTWHTHTHTHIHICTHVDVCTCILQYEQTLSMGADQSPLKSWC